MLNQPKYSLTISILTLFLAACGGGGGGSTPTNTQSTDTTAPQLSEVTPVATPTQNNQPDYTFSSSESGAISFQGACTSASTNATAGSNTITLNSLSVGTYTDCEILVTDASGNKSAPLKISSFEIVNPISASFTNHIVFPQTGSNTDGSREISIRGLINSTNGSSLALDKIASFLVNNESVSVDPDTGVWNTTVDLQNGENQLPVTVHFTDTSTIETVLTLDNTPILPTGGQIAYDSTNQILYVYGATDRRIHAINLLNSSHRLVSTPRNGSKLLGAKGLEIDATNNRLIMFSQSENSLIAVDTITGAQTTLSSQAMGAGPNFSSGTDVKVTADKTKAYVVDAGNSSVIAVDLSSGNRTTISGLGTGTGPNLPLTDFIAGLDLDEINNRIFVYSAHDVYQIDIATGDRAVISDANIRTSSSSSAETVLDLENNRILYTRYESIHAVDITSGNETTLVNIDTNGELYTFEELNGIATSPSGDIFLSHRTTGEIIKLNASGYSSETLLIDVSIGNGIPLKGSTALALNPSANKAYIAYSGNYYGGLASNVGIATINLATGDRESFVDQNSNFDLYYSDISDLNYDSTNDRLIALGNELWTVNLANGALSNLSPIRGTAFDLSSDGSQAFVGEWNYGRLSLVALDNGNTSTIQDSYTSTLGVTLNETGSTVFILDSLNDRVYGVDLESGIQLEISSNDIGQGTSINYLTDLIYDADGFQLIASDSNERHLLAIDTATGDRSVLTSESIGNGAQINSIARSGLKYDPTKKLLYLADDITGTLVIIDKSSGDKIIISR